MRKVRGYSLRKSPDCDEAREVFFKIAPSDDYPAKEDSVIWLLRDAQNNVCGIVTAHDCGYNTLYGSFRGLLPSAWGKGLDSKLIRIRETYGRRHNYEYLITYALSHNGPSIVNLIKHKYKIYEPQYPWAVENSVYFFKKLD